MTSSIQLLKRRAVLAMALSATLAVPFIGAAPVFAATPAEAFISDNIQKGLGILNDPQLSAAQRSEQFEQLLITLTNMKRIAIFTLGQYARDASPAELRADFAAAFPKLFGRGLSLLSGPLCRLRRRWKVTGRAERAPDDYIVSTVMVDPGNRGRTAAAATGQFPGPHRLAANPN